MGEQTTDKKALNIKQFTIILFGAWLHDCLCNAIYSVCIL